ncbi:DUF2710 family protein [Mycobacteroides abscessus]|uniref:DUF2710 family protein n=1 Tax=Mycobacteroides abscessus TaxID=36809 RepID=UPI0013FD6AD8|nr:DUF2710 family protein [Mycobacteroides abscessus]
MTDVPGDDLDSEDYVDDLIRAFERGADAWDEQIALKEDSLFPVSMGDIEAVGDRDGRLRSLWLHPAVMGYSPGEFQSRMNMMIRALHDKAVEVFDPNALYDPMEPM